MSIVLTKPSRTGQCARRGMQPRPHELRTSASSTYYVMTPRLRGHLCPWSQHCMFLCHASLVHILHPALTNQQFRQDGHLCPDWPAWPHPAATMAAAYTAQTMVLAPLKSLPDCISNTPLKHHSSQTDSQQPWDRNSRSQSQSQSQSLRRRRCRSWRRSFTRRRRLVIGSEVILHLRLCAGVATLL